MSNEYAVPGQRKSKRDQRKKRAYRVYKRGGPKRVLKKKLKIDEKS